MTGYVFFILPSISCRKFEIVRLLKVCKFSSTDSALLSTMFSARSFIATETACFTSFPISSLSCDVKLEMSNSAFSGAFNFVIKGRSIAALQLSFSQEFAITRSFIEMRKIKIAHPSNTMKAILEYCLFLRKSSLYILVFIIVYVRMQLFYNMALVCLLFKQIWLTIVNVCSQNSRNYLLCEVIII